MREGAVGLDTVEVIMEIEEHFQVTISDTKAQELLTVGHLYLFLIKETRTNMPNGCPTRPEFYRLRRTLTQQFGIQRQLVVPSAKMRELFPTDMRAIAWPQLASSLKLPSLPDPDPPSKAPTAKALARLLISATAGAWLL